MIYIALNAVPIAMAMIASLLIGAVWLKLAAQGQLGWAKTALIALALFWSAAILAGALILAPPEASAWTMAIGSAVVIWIGFVAPAIAVTLSVAGVAAARIASACGYWLVAMVLQAVIMQAWGLVPPPST